MTPRDALEAVRDWGGKIGQGGYKKKKENGADAAADDPDTMERGGKKKKAIKGDAYELGLTAFARIYGWDKK